MLEFLNFLWNVTSTALTVGLAVKCIYDICIIIKGCIDRYSLRKALHQKDIWNAVIDEVDRSRHTVSLSDLDTGNRIEVRGDNISYDVINGDVL